MKLHLDKEIFNDLITLTTEYVKIPEIAIKRDYFIVLLLKRLHDSEYAEECVFKGGTSLSKCYPGSINRFSEDIDLTFIPEDELSQKQYNNNLKKIEKVIIGSAYFEKIDNERSDRNKSSYVWFDEENKDGGRIKLEIGSSVKPDPYEKKVIESYIQEYLEYLNMKDVISKYELSKIELNVLCIERTFIDKVFSVKRHAICDTIKFKVRHIYDVTRLFKMKEIQEFLNNKRQLKEIVRKTKITDSYYLGKRNIAKEYNPVAAYNFKDWSDCFDKDVKTRYENLHNDLLYTNEKQNFLDAIKTFENISDILDQIDE